MATEPIQTTVRLPVTVFLQRTVPALEQVVGVLISMREVHQGMIPSMNGRAVVVVDILHKNGEGGCPFGNPRGKQLRWYSSLTLLSDGVQHIQEFGKTIGSIESFSGARRHFRPSILHPDASDMPGTVNYPCFA